MRGKLTLVVAIVALAVVLPAHASRIWVANLSGGQETPPNDSHRTGTGVFTPFSNDDSLQVDVRWQGVQGGFTGIHIHHGLPGVAGPIVISLVPLRQGNHATGAVAMADSVLTWLLAGELYVNVHSNFYPAGEIRGQLVCQADTVELEPDEIGESYCLALCSGAADTSIIEFGPVGEGQIPTFSIQLGCMINGQPCDTSNDEEHVVDNGCTPATFFTTGDFIFEDSTYYLPVHGDGCVCVTLDAVADPQGRLNDSRAELKGNYPNPFNPVTEISFDLREAGQVKLSVYDITGRLVTQLANSPMSAGSHSVQFNATNLPSGVYIYRLETPGFADQRKMLLLK